MEQQFIIWKQCHRCKWHLLNIIDRYSSKGSSFRNIDPKQHKYRKSRYQTSGNWITLWGLALFAILLDKSWSIRREVGSTRIHIEHKYTNSTQIHKNETSRNIVPWWSDCLSLISKQSCLIIKRKSSQSHKNPNSYPGNTFPNHNVMIFVNDFSTNIKQHTSQTFWYNLSFEEKNSKRWKLL